MRIIRIKKNDFKILLVTILCVNAFSATSRANSRDVSFREIFSESQNETGEAYYFFIPQIADDNNQYTYVYDTKLDRLLFFPRHKDLITKIKGQEIDPEDWVKFTQEGRHEENQHQTGYIPEPWHYRFLGEKRIRPFYGFNF